MAWGGGGAAHADVRVAVAAQRPPGGEAATPDVVDGPGGRQPGKRVRGHGLRRHVGHATAAEDVPDQVRGAADRVPPDETHHQDEHHEHDEDRQDPERDRAAGQVAGVGAAAPVAAPQPRAQPVRRGGRHHARRDEPRSAAAAEPAGRLARRAAVPTDPLQRRRAVRRTPRPVRTRPPDAAAGRPPAPAAGVASAAGAAGRGPVLRSRDLRSGAGGGLGPGLLLRCRRGRGGRGRGGGHGIGLRGAGPVQETVAVLAELPPRRIAGAAVLAHHRGHRTPSGCPGRRAADPASQVTGLPQAGRCTPPPLAGIRKNG